MAQAMPAGAWIFAAAVLAAGCVLLVTSEGAEATHFRAGTLQWNFTPSSGTILDDVQDELAPVAFVSGRQAWRWDSLSETGTGVNAPPACSFVGMENPIMFTDGGNENYERIILSTDVTRGDSRNMAIVKLVRVGSDVGACDPDDQSAAYHIPHTFRSPNQGPGMPHQVSWQSCCRLEFGTGGDGNYHVNNDGNKAERLESFIDMEDPNRSPIVKLVPLRYCPIDAMCRFRIEAMDPDRDRLTYRLSTSVEAMGPSPVPFYQPGPDCGRCSNILYSLAVDRNTGWVAWDTTGAEVVPTSATARNLYSTQIMVEDGTTGVPVDFMIELIEAPEDLCPDGSVPPIDDWTGEYRYDLCDRPATCDDPERASDPECRLPPDWEYRQAPQPQARPAADWRLPPAEAMAGLPASVSRLLSSDARPVDRVDWEVARRDSDGDGLIDRSDACSMDPRGGGVDLDGDGVGDACDPDMDGDGVLDGADACPLDPTDHCVRAPAPPRAVSAAQVAGGSMQRSAGPERGHEGVAIASPPAAVSPVGWVMLAVLAGALMVLLVAMAMRRRS